MDRTTAAYAQAFDLYLRKGIRPDLTLKKHTGYYVWRTRNDRKVRPEHAANDGRVFSWDDPPDTGHPGEDYGCRCRAEPYVEGETEYADHRIMTPLGSANPWSSFDSVKHFYLVGGRALSLDEIGHLKAVVEHYRDHHGAFRRVAGQVADAARDQKVGSFVYEFEKAYDFQPIAWVHGDGAVSGNFQGTVRESNGLLNVEGDCFFDFTDVFTDPTGRASWLGVEKPHELPLAARLGTDLLERPFISSVTGTPV